MRDTGWEQLKLLENTKGKAGGSQPAGPESLAEAGQAAGWGQAPPEKVLTPSPCASGHNQKKNCGTKDGELLSWARVLKVSMGYSRGRGEEMRLAEESGSWAAVAACLVLAR